MTTPNYRDPYYWTSLLAPPLVLSFGIIFATTYGVSFGVQHGINSSLKELRTSEMLQDLTRHALGGATKYIHEVDIVKEITKQVVMQFRALSLTSAMK